MAKKEIDFVIKVNNKQLDLTKVSFEQFDKVIKQAKKDLTALPLNDPRYKILSKDIKTAEASWKAAQEAAKGFGEETEESGDKVKTYSQQIRIASKELISLEQQFGKNSQQYQDQANKISNLREKQEELTRGTQKLDDALSNIPGPIGQIGQGMQSLDQITGSVKSAFNSLTKMFPILDSAIAKSGIGALVLLLVVLVAAVVNAAKKSEPLQQAFAVMGDAVGALFDALKPLTDFIINVFVGAVEIAAAAINSLASIFGGVNRGFKQESLLLEKEIKKNENLLNNFSEGLSKKYTEILKILTDYQKRKNEIDNEAYKDEEQRKNDLLLNDYNYVLKKNEIETRYQIDAKNRKLEIYKSEKEINLKGLDNNRQSTLENLQLQKKSSEDELENLRKASINRANALAVLYEDSKTAGNKFTAEATAALLEATKEEVALSDHLNELKKNKIKSNNAEILKTQREFNREDINLIEQHSLKVIEVTTNLIKEENARNLQEAKDNLIQLKENQRLELEQITLNQGKKSIVYKSALKKQVAEEKLAKEEIRKAQLQFDAYTLQLQINEEDRNLREELSRSSIKIKNLESFYQRKRDLSTQELDRDFILADGSYDKEEEAKTKHWERILAIDQEELGNITSNLELEYQGMYQVSADAFQKLRDIEEAKYKEQQRGNEQNYEKMEALAKDHAKKMNMIDVEELNTMADLLQRRAEARYDIEFGFFKKTREAESVYYAARVKAAGDNIALLEVLEQEHLKRLRDINRQELNTYLQYATQIMGAIQTVISDMAKVTALQQQLATERLTEAYIKQNELDKRTITNQTELEKKLFANKKKFAEDEDKLKKEAFEQNKKIQIAQAIIGTLQGAVQAFTSLAVIPVVGPVLGGIAAAAALVFGYKQVDLIKQTTYQSSLALSNSESTGSGGAGGGSGGGATSPPNQLGRNYAEGGMIQGPSHAGGGVMINAEGGEVVMTKGAVTMFAPLLSMMNQAGGGTSFSKSAMGGAKYDNPRITKQITEPQIIKTYVVATDMSSEQQKQNRLKDLSTL
jgi:hypothetical protein